MPGEGASGSFTLQGQGLDENRNLFMRCGCVREQPQERGVDGLGAPGADPLSLIYPRRKVKKRKKASECIKFVIFWKKRRMTTMSLEEKGELI